MFPRGISDNGSHMLSSVSFSPKRSQKNICLRLTSPVSALLLLSVSDEPVVGLPGLSGAMSVWPDAPTSGHVQQHHGLLLTLGRVSQSRVPPLFRHQEQRGVSCLGDANKNSVMTLGTVVAHGRF